MNNDINQINHKHIAIIANNMEQRKELKKKGILILNNVFNDDTFEELYFDLYNLITDNNIPAITLYIHSNGGYCNALLPLFDLIKKSNKIISTIVMGKAYSSGAMLALAGTKGYRYAHKHSEILLHEVASSIPNEKNSQIQEEAKNIDRTNKIMKELVKQNSKMKVKDLDKYFNSNKDIFIDSNQALKYGIIDKII